MNYYEQHIGDYLTKTVHLSMVEDGAYRRLIDSYYSREAPLPAEKVECYKLARAYSKTERQAVDSVLAAYFVLQEDGWHQERCDEEISKYHARKPELEAKRENDKERQRRAREQRKQLFEDLSGRGIHMPWNATTEQLRAELSRVTMAQPSQPVTRDNTATHLPHPTTHLSPERAVVTPHSSANANPAVGAVSPMDAGLMSKALRERNVTVTPSNPELLTWIAEGATISLVMDAVTEARVSKPEPEKIPAAYLTAIVRRLLAGPKPRASPHGKHGGFEKLDYGAGIDEQGRF